MQTFLFLQIRSARLAWFSSLVVLLLQRTPLIRVLVQWQALGDGGRAGQLLRAMIPLAVAAGRSTP